MYRKRREEEVEEEKRYKTRETEVEEEKRGREERQL